MKKMIEECKRRGGVGCDECEYTDLCDWVEDAYKTIPSRLKETGMKLAEEKFKKMMKQFKKATEG